MHEQWRAMVKAWTKRRARTARLARQREADIRARRKARADLAVVRAARDARREEERRARQTERAAASLRASEQRRARQERRAAERAAATMRAAARIHASRPQTAATAPGGAGRCGVPTADGTPCQRLMLPGTDDCGAPHHTRWGTLMSESDLRFWRLRNSGWRGPIDQDGRPVTGAGPQ